MRCMSCKKMGIVLAVSAACLFICGERARGDFVFSEPTKVPNVSRPGAGGPQISRDGLELYFVYEGENACQDIWVARRSSLTEEWSAPVSLDFPVNSPWPVGGPCISPDGLELYFSDGMPVQYEATGCVPNSAGYGGGDIWVSRRATRWDAWGNPVNLGPPVNTGSYEDHPCLTSDGLSLYFTSKRSGSHTLWVTTRPATDALWGQPERLGPPVDMIMYETTPFISPDGLSLYFSEGGWAPDMYVSRRTSVTGSWGSPVAFAPVNSAGAEYHLSFANGDSKVYFTRADGFIGGYDLWQVEVTPVVDLNGDGVVDATDISILIDHWGQNTSSYDIGPLPLGDGVVGGEDLEVLYEYVDVNLAVVPTPALNETGVAPFVSLNWTRGTFAETYDVYFGTSFDDVYDADRANPTGVLVSQDQNTNTYDFMEPLGLGQTYHWRVDEVNVLSDPGIFKGVVWSFTTDSVVGLIKNVVATASSAKEGSGPEHTIDGSGLDAGDLHSTAPATMWLSATDGPQPTWIQYEFDGVYPLDVLWVWNYNGQFEQVIGTGFKGVTIEHSEDGATWTTLGDVEFSQGTSQSDYGYNTVVDFGGEPAKYVRLTAQSNWGGIAPQYGLSEVRFFYVPPLANEAEATSN